MSLVERQTTSMLITLITSNVCQSQGSSFSFYCLSLFFFSASNNNNNNNNNKLVDQKAAQDVSILVREKI